MHYGRTSAPSPKSDAAASEQHTTSRPSRADADSTEADHSRLYGTWEAESVEVPQPGEVRIRLTFKKEGPAELLAWSDIPFVGQVRDKSAPFTVKNGQISSSALRGGTTVDYRFSDDGKLLIEWKDGKTVTFHKVD